MSVKPCLLNEKHGMLAAHAIPKATRKTWIGEVLWRSFIVVIGLYGFTGFKIAGVLVLPKKAGAFVIGTVTVIGFGLISG